ncbi:MAG: protein serine/threonine phosphatase 2C family protein [Deltaproteobacteria bacterium]|nr:protein serine/threonine phosphatase 2C family protein [Deltaproteobacteria bacterium]
MHTMLIVASEGDEVAPGIELEAAGRSDVGRERERNEDQFLIATLQQTMHVVDTSVTYDPLRWLPSGGKGILMLVADGMGGTGSGDVASSVAVRTITNYLCNVVPATQAVVPSQSPLRQSTIPGMRQGLKKALEKGDDEVRRAAESKGTSDTMGTTLTMAYVRWPHLYVAHVGDTRCYLYRDEELFQLTTDHTLAEQLRERTKMEVDDSSPWHHVLWNALGGGETPSAEPQIIRRKLLPTDGVLLCSDGLNKHVSDEEITVALRASSSAEDACKRLVAMANADGGEDNITVLVARSREAASEAETAPTLRRPKR